MSEGASRRCRHAAQWNFMSTSSATTPFACGGVGFSGSGMAVGSGRATGFGAATGRASGVDAVTGALLVAGTGLTTGTCATEGFSLSPH